MSVSPEEEAGRQVPTNKLKAGGEDIAGSAPGWQQHHPHMDAGPVLGRCTRVSSQ